MYRRLKDFSAVLGWAEKEALSRWHEGDRKFSRAQLRIKIPNQ